MSGYPGMKAINWERRTSDGTVGCSKCNKVIPAGQPVEVRLDGYAGDPTSFCAGCVTPVAPAKPEAPRQKQPKVTLLRDHRGKVYARDERGTLRRATEAQIADFLNSRG